MKRNDMPDAITDPNEIAHYGGDDYGMPRYLHIRKYCGPNIRKYCGPITGYKGRYINMWPLDKLSCTGCGKRVPRGLITVLKFQHWNMGRK